MSNSDSKSDTETLSFKDWAMRMRRRAARHAVRASVWEAQAMALARKPKSKPRRGEAATDLGLRKQEIAAEFAHLRALVRELAELAAWPLPLEERKPARRRRARRRSRRASATSPITDAQ